MMTPALRRFTFTTHITSAIGWVGADPVVDLEGVRNASPILHAILALVLLVGATVLGVYKPFVATAYGESKLVEQRRRVSLRPASAATARALHADSTPAWIYVVATATETIERALDLVVFQRQLIGGTRAMRGIEITSPDEER